MKASQVLGTELAFSAATEQTPFTNSTNRLIVPFVFHLACE
jgi:hypothetical protein